MSENGKLFHGRNDVVWHDRKRILGMPISFTVYYLSEDRLFIETGFFTTKQESILLYRIRDLSLVRTLGQKMFRVGSVTVLSSDKTAPDITLKNIKFPQKISELLHSRVEEAKIKHRMRFSEIMTDGGDSDGDGIPDMLDDDM